MTLLPHLRTTIVLAWLAAAGLLASPCLASAAQSAQSQKPPLPVATMYANALAEATAVRKALAAPKPARTVLRAVRTAIADFESVVRYYPTSSYCDDALWHAANLAKEAFELFSEPREAATSARLYKLLASEYPSSRYARQVPVQLKALEASVAAAGTKAATAAAAPAKDAPAASPASAASAAASSPAATSTEAAPTSASAAPAGSSSPASAVATPTAASAADTPATIRDIRRSVLPDVVRVVIELDREVTFHDERLSGPDRVFVDLTPTKADFKLIDHTLRYDGDNDVVGQIRIGRHPNNVTRVVLDTEGVSSYSVYPLYSPFRLVIDCLRENRLERRPTPIESDSAAARLPDDSVVPASGSRGPAPAVLPASAAAAPALAPGSTALPAAGATTPAANPAPAAETASPASRAGTAGGASTVTPASPTAAAAAPSSTASATTTTRTLPPVKLPGTAKGAAPLSMARQLGMGVSRIVIDPGHGGHDPGAKGRGITEAELVLDVALRLERLLEKLEGVDVVLTRRTDEFVSLEERTAIANREGANLFLSIHVNASSSPSARGVETYYLDFATTQSAAAVAARENATSNKTMASLQDVLKAIALNNKVDESRDFAAHVHRQMVSTLKAANRNVRDLGVKQAPFVVLIGAAMPSVLAEVSFLSNADEARLLKSGAYRQRIAQALFDGLKNYQRSLKPGSSVAQRQD